MERRELLKMIAVLTGTAFIGGEVLLTGCKNPDVSSGITFSESDLQFLNEVGETILPATTTPGAKAANVSQVMKSVVMDCYKAEEQPVFYAGISKINEASKSKFNQSFLDATPAQREELLNEIDREAKEYQKNKKGDDVNHYYTMMKQLTLLGYFTSEAGCKEALLYIPVPQRYDGCVDYKPGDRAIFER